MTAESPLGSTTDLTKFVVPDMNSLPITHLIKRMIGYPDSLVTSTPLSTSCLIGQYCSRQQLALYKIIVVFPTPAFIIPSSTMKAGQQGKSLSVQG